MRQDRDGVAPADSMIEQPAGQLARPCLELAVGPRPLRVLDGERGRNEPGLPREALVDRAVPPGWERRGGIGEVGTGLRRDQRHVVQIPPGLFRDLPEGEDELVQELLDPPRVEEVRAVNGVQVDGSLDLGRVKAQVELGVHRFGAERFRPERTEAQLLLGNVDEVEPDLEDRRPRKIAWRVERAEERLERDVLVCVGAQRRFAHPREEVAESRARSAGLDPQGERVDEEADEPLGLLVGAVRHGHTDGEVILARPSGQDERVGREQHHVEGSALRARQPPESVCEIGVESPADARPGVALGGQPGAVGRQLQRRHPVELAPPVGELPLELRPCEPAALPDGVVRVLDGRLRRRGPMPS